MPETPEICESKVNAILDGEYMAGALTIEEAVALYDQESASFDIVSVANLCGVSVLEMVNHLQSYDVRVDP